MRTFAVRLVIAGGFVIVSGCGTGLTGLVTCDLQNPDCPKGLVCSAIIEGTALCVAPLLIKGDVLHVEDDLPITGALVQAVDVNGAAVGTAGETDEDGRFTLIVPAVRNTDGVPVEGSYTLRVQAMGFQSFPTALRPALPINADTADWQDPEWVIENPLTTVKLIPVPGDVALLGAISGRVMVDVHSGILVVAEGGGEGLTGFSDADGDYMIFNVPAGSYEVKGFFAGVQLDPAAADVTAGETTTDVNLMSSDRPLNSVSGDVQIVDAPGGSLTSIILAVESTFNDDAARGTAPPGLRVGEVSGAFILEQVPDGRYVVLAAFENDGLVRDPDQTIAGTKIVRIELPDPIAGNDLVLSEGFKVTEALAVVSPGAVGPEIVNTPTPEFVWADDSSEDGYEIRVFDAFGNLIWEDEIGPVSGSATVSYIYPGPPDAPALEDGMFYQFRTTSFRDKQGGRTAISATEDLRGVFQFLEPDAEE